MLLGVPARAVPGGQLPPWLMNQRGVLPALLPIIAGVREGQTGVAVPRARSQSCASPAGCSPQNHPPTGAVVGTRVQGWALPVDAELVALSPRRVPGGGDRAGSQLVSPASLVKRGCWLGLGAAGG